MAMIDRNFTFATNGTVSAADLHNLIDSATIYQDLITGQLPITSVGTNYELLIADGTNPNAAPNAVTVYDLFEDALSVGTYTGLNLTGALTYGTATGNRTVSTSATITTGTITNLTSSTANITLGTISNFTTTLAGDFTISQGTGTLGTSGVTSGTYGATITIPIITVDGKGRITTMSTALAQAGATGGGSNRVFYENDTNVTTTYTISTNKNAMSAGPITIDNGIIVTVQDGSVWTVV
jgi:hypothetical protein